MNDFSLENELASFIGIGNYYLHWLRCFKYTDGVKYLADKAQCYWLLDVIASYQCYQKIKSVGFQIWQLKVKDDNSAVVTMREDIGLPVIVRQKIPYTDFPLKEIKLYLDVGVLMLPSEY